MQFVEDNRSPRLGDHIPDYLVLSQMFPPAVGGSGMLLENVYSRITDADVTVLVDAASYQRERPMKGRMRTESTRFNPHSWGIFDPRAWRNQLQLARTVYRRASDMRAIVHCARAQPEAIPAFAASLMPRGPRYIFWAHGEEITVALSSQQFAMTMRLVYRGASATIANSRNTARLMQATGWYRGQIHVVYPGVDAGRFHPQADDGRLRRQLAPHGELLLLSVARLQPRKGHDLVLKALAELRWQIPEVRYIVVGDGGERERLQALAKTLQLNEDSVLFAGEISEDALPGYFAACDIFVMPTRVEGPDFEGFGLVYLEASAAGKPVVGGRNGGVPEAVADGETGILVSGNDVQELVRTLRELCLSAELRHRMGDAGRARALRDFTWEKSAAQVTEIHHEVARAIQAPTTRSPSK